MLVWSGIVLDQTIVMASSAHKLLDTHRLSKLWAPYQSATLNSTPLFPFKRYCSIAYGTSTQRCKKIGLRFTLAKSAAQESVEVAQNAFQFSLLPIADDIQIQEENIQNGKMSKEAIEMERCIETVKYMFQSMEDGVISISAYDTAWVARVPALDGSGKPEFPSSLQWIIDHQLTDGSWGDPYIFHIFDRIINTLACVIALKTWNAVPHGVDKGLSFLQMYIPKINDQHDIYTPIGFEIVFPALMVDAKVMNLHLPYDNEVLQQFSDERALKLKRIPREVLHNYPSTLLHSLEGLRDEVDWAKLLKLQSKDGSFLFSPASTACALARTGDANCVRYLSNITEKHNGGVPNVYPVDLFENLWAVDRVERLGIARYFQEEITERLEYVYRYWTNQGIGWARESPVQDVDDTAMAFRLLRLHGFNVTTEAFSQFKQGDQFICFAGQASQAVTGMYNLYRASQVSFPGESILEEAQNFTKNFLEDKRAKNQIQDKWIISKGLEGEVEYALDFPWYASQPRIETRMYIEQYGVEDVWIGKSLYRMPFVNNDTYIELAKADFNLCQSIHRKELEAIIRWSRGWRFEKVGLVEDSIVTSYFLAAVSLFEPDVAPARLAWAYSMILMAAVRKLFSSWHHSCPHRKHDFLQAFERWDITTTGEDIPNTEKRVLKCLFRTINLLSVDGGAVQGRDISADLRHAWNRWLAYEEGHTNPEEEDEKNVGSDADVIVMSTSLLAGEVLSPASMSHPDFIRTMKLTNTACSLLRAAKSYKEQRCDGHLSATEQAGKLKCLTQRADEAMRELVWAVHDGQCEVAGTVKRVCLSVCRSFYYAAHCNNEKMGDHVDMLLFNPA